MLQVPRDIQVAFDRRIEEALVRREERPTYRKWLRFYLDFCLKYGHSARTFAETSSGTDRDEKQAFDRFAFPTGRGAVRKARQHPKNHYVIDANLPKLT
jgi:hypothetical protein